ncbi:TonB-dependent receptor precursor [Sphingopyxis sp. LC81]|uniref:TonB-dependent receptor n=1 Tax=Sphingopyxis sp. LC81 TaxID=1502850 RepID=UPI00050D9255|nr:TonB-dependent receptor [Sphingopyxis sp. LC81]KGB56292.1 TonB-dependent receptor precursor [Sphingopyxis sp. LC81]
MGTRSNLTFALLAASSALAFPAFAQTPTAPAGSAAENGSSAASEPGGLEEIVVTAQKRSENLQTVPLSLTAFSGDTLEKSAVTSIAELAARTPNVSYDTFSPGQPRYFIRGIGGTASGSARDGAIGIFVDDVYMGRPAMTGTDFVDLARVEVLRGPQGTLFGRNVVGGAISYFTLKPDDEFRAQAALTLGNYRRIDGNFLVSGPISDTLSAKVAVSSRNHNGYAFNETTGKDIEDEQSIVARGALRFQPNSDVDIQLNADISRLRATGNWWHLLREGPNSIGKSNADPRRGRNHTDDGFSDVDNGGVSLNARFQTGIGEIASITAYRESTSSTRANTTGLFVAPLTDPNRGQFHHTLFIQQSDVDSSQFSQELRLASEIGSDISTVIGLFYFHENVKSTDITDYRFVSRNSEGRRRFDGRNKTDSYAAFANIAWDVTDELKLRAGLRWSLDKKDHVAVAGGNNFVPYRDGGVIVPGFTAPGKDSWDAFTPSLSINYQATPTKFFYASLSRGFKSGGFSDTEIEKLSAMTAFDPEFAWNYEVGMKTEWFDRRLRFNASLFYTDYTDLQVTVIRIVDPAFPPFGTTGNAGKVVIKGAELEVNAIPVDGWNIYGNYAYTDSNIKELVVGTADLAGNRLGRSPKHKFFVGTSYETEIGGGYKAAARVEYTYSSSFFSSINNTPVELIDGQRSLDLGLTLTTPDDKWSVDFWGKNMTDRLNINTITEVPLRDGYASFLPPRTFGATLRFRY